MDIKPDLQQDTTELQNPQDPADTVAIQNASEPWEVTTNNPQSFTITNNSNLLQIPTRNISENVNNDPNPENTSILSTSNINITHTTPTILLKKVQSSNSNDTTIIPVQRELHFQATTPTRQPVLQILSYTTSQTTQTQNIQLLYVYYSILIHYLTIQLLEVFLDLLQTIPNNPLSYSLTTTNPNNTQDFSTQNNTTMNSFLTSQSSVIKVNKQYNTEHTFLFIKHSFHKYKNKPSY